MNNQINNNETIYGYTKPVHEFAEKLIERLKRRFTQPKYPGISNLTTSRNSASSQPMSSGTLSA